MHAGHAERMLLCRSLCNVRPIMDLVNCLHIPCSQGFITGELAEWIHQAHVNADFSGEFVAIPLVCPEQGPRPAKLSVPHAQLHTMHRPPACLELCQALAGSLAQAGRARRLGGRPYSLLYPNLTLHPWIAGKVRQGGQGARATQGCGLLVDAVRLRLCDRPGMACRLRARLPRHACALRADTQAWPLGFS